MRQKIKSGQCFFLFTVILVFASMTSVTGQELIDKSTEKQENIKEQVVYAPFRENLKLSFSDTILSSKSYYFSDSNSKDIFRLIVRPGFVKNSKSEFQIKSSNGTIIYSKVFDSFALLMRIFEPIEIPKDTNYETYREEYGKSLTIGQFKTYFNKSVKDFFDNISFIDRPKFQEMIKWGYVNDKEALKKVLADSTTKLINLNCFDCDTGGGTVLYFSKQKGKIIEILGHD